ncbi:hypothetical protein HG535_0F01430 [Zygotorulaspora mrakii]|uniref:Protein BIG1 n=1 Tax=Zygotorulaspora mrakii TaxID=42260 RepID=A0A7H9B7D4_ZYGMR|nr:uncharacterized protein HG535_0F01430 [Zygotorulaspora mrakii]QLG73632.1 hypothetical protein HG535_0F01430 [Zygotorulaspora mrakii]
MRLIILCWGTLIILLQATKLCAYDYQVSSFTTSVLDRLNNAEGDKVSINFMELLTIISNESGEKRLIASKVIDTAEEIIISGDNKEASPNKLHRFKILCDEIMFLEQVFSSELNNHKWSSQFFHKKSLTRIIKTYIAYESYVLKRISEQTNASYSKTLRDVTKHLLSCKNALLAGVRTLQLMHTAKGNEIHDLVTANFHSGDTSSINGENLVYAIMPQKGNQTQEIASDITYLRQNFLVLVKSGVFMMLCAAVRVYFCAFTFGAMMMSSSVIWMLVYLQLMDKEL